MIFTVGLKISNFLSFFFYHTHAFHLEKQSTLTFQPKKPAATKKTTTTKKSSAFKFSDSESDAEDDLTIDDFSDEDYEPPVKKTTAARKATKVYTVNCPFILTTLCLKLLCQFSPSNFDNYLKISCQTSLYLDYIKL